MSRHSRRLIAALAALSLAAGCSTVLNPFNWFGGGREVATLEPVAVIEARDPRPLMDQVTDLRIERTPGGAIIRATGLPPTQGWYEGELVPVGGAADGTLVYDFRAFPPPAPARTSTPQSREVVVGLFLTAQDLAGISTIRVNAAQNARAARR
jgi:hypothetical protein